MRFLAPRVEKHTRTVILDMPTMGWTVLRAAFALSGGQGYASTMGGYRVPQYWFDIGIELSYVDDAVIYTDMSYTTVCLTVVEPSYWRDTLSRAAGAYEERLDTQEKRLLQAVEWMRQHDPLPQTFFTFLCYKNQEYCSKEVIWNVDEQRNVCPVHGPLKSGEVNKHDPVFENVPRLR